MMNNAGVATHLSILNTLRWDAVQSLNWIASSTAPWSSMTGY